MEKYFVYEKTVKLETFSQIHLVTMFLILLFWIFSIVVLKYINRKKGNDENMFFRYTVASLLVLSEISFSSWHAATGHFSIQESLPLHMCDITSFTCAVMLVKENRFLFQLNYFAGVGGALQAILTPTELHQFPHYDFINHFLYHALLILSVFYMIFIRKWKPEWKMLLKVFLVINTYMGIIYIFNSITGSDYLYLNRPPAPPNLIDPFLVNLLGPSPAYIIGIEILVMALFALMMLPFEISAFLKRRKVNDLS